MGRSGVGQNADVRRDVSRMGRPRRAALRGGGRAGEGRRRDGPAARRRRPGTRRSSPSSRPQLARSPFLVVAVTGGTNTGKSTIFNNLLGSRASRVTATAMGSKHPVCILPRTSATSASSDGSSPGSRSAPGRRRKTRSTDTPDHLLFYREDPGGLLPERLVLLDTPDVDGPLSDHWERARLVRGAADVLLAVLTQQKHNDAAVRRFFTEAAGAEKVVFVAFNMVQWPDDRDDCKDWLRVFREGTGVDPAHVYVAPHDRKAAEALRLPFLGLDGEPKAPVRDLADLHFGEIKVRTFRGSLRRSSTTRTASPPSSARSRRGPASSPRSAPRSPTASASRSAADPAGPDHRRRHDPTGSGPSGPGSTAPSTGPTARLGRLVLAPFLGTSDGGRARTTRSRS